MGFAMAKRAAKNPSAKSPTRRSALATAAKTPRAEAVEAAAAPPAPAAAKPRPTSRSRGAGRKLVIVESPAKAKTIGRYLGPGYAVRACRGHVRDLPRKRLGVDIAAGFVPEYEIIKGKGVGELKKAAKSAEAVYLAPDLDRETL